MPEIMPISPLFDKLDILVSRTPRTLEMSRPTMLSRVRRTADELLALAGDVREIETLERRTAANRDSLPLALHLAIKLARSRSALRALNRPLQLSVVFAVFREHTRLLPHGSHPHGENLLQEKINQLSWLCRDLPAVTWDMTVVDDGCDRGSGRQAQKILASCDGGERVRVLFLEEAIHQGLPVTRPMRTTADSRKGGAIAYGMWAAGERGSPHQVILYTDADLSTDLGQSGLLVSELLRNDADVAIGSRREPTSVVVKGDGRNVRGKLFIYLWKRLLNNLDGIIDTQCGFKAFRAGVVREIIQGLREKRFAFDIELLLKARLRGAGGIITVPVAWVDSEAASTTTNLQPYLPMLKSIAGFYRHYLPGNPEAEPFAALLERLREDDWKRLMENVPEAISRRQPHQFETFAGVSPETLARAAGLS